MLSGSTRPLGAVSPASPPPLPPLPPFGSLPPSLARAPPAPACSPASPFASTCQFGPLAVPPSLSPFGAPFAPSPAGGLPLVQAWAPRPALIASTANSQDLEKNDILVFTGRGPTAVRPKVKVTVSSAGRKSSD